MPRGWWRGSPPAAVWLINSAAAPRQARARAPRCSTSPTARCAATVACRRSSPRFRAAACPTRWSQALLWCALYALESGRYAEYTVVDQAVRACALLERWPAKGYVNAAAAQRTCASRNAVEARSARRRRGALPAPAMVDRPRARRLSRALGGDSGRRQRASADGAAREYAPRCAGRLLCSASPKQASPRARAGDAALLLERPVPVERLPGFAGGEVSVQDAARAARRRSASISRRASACSMPAPRRAARALISWNAPTSRSLRSTLDADALRTRRRATWSGWSLRARRARGRLHAAANLVGWRAFRPHPRRRAVLGLRHRAAPSRPQVAAPRRRCWRRSPTRQAAILDALWQLLARGW